MVSAIDSTKPRDGVPAKKADLRANLGAAKAEIEELQFRKIENGMPFDMAGEYLRHPTLKSYKEVIVNAQLTEGYLILDLSAGNVFKVVLTQDVRSINLKNPPPQNYAGSVVLIVMQDNAGGREFNWPSSIIWPDGNKPVVSTPPATRDIYTLVTIDGGITWFGFVAGQAFR